MSSICQFLSPPTISNPLAVCASRYGIHFTGPVKMGSGGFPINEMRWQLSTMERGEHIVLKLAGKDIWAVGWHDHHYKCYITTHGMTLPPSLPCHNPTYDLEGASCIIYRIFPVSCHVDQFDLHDRPLEKCDKYCTAHLLVHSIFRSFINNTFAF